MSMVIEAEAPPLKKWDDGSIRVGGTRLLLETVVCAYNHGRSAEEIAHSFLGVSLADIHSVIAYYLRHQPEVDAYVEWVEKEGGILRQKYEALYPTMEFRKRLQARHKAMQQQS